MAKVVTMGELLVRLSTINYERLDQSKQLEVCYGGSEANVAVSLAGFGHESVYITRLPENPIAQAAVKTLRKHGVDTSKIAWGGTRMGLYFLETGSGYRPSNVVYDRADSAMSLARLDDFDFDEIFAGADWFHYSGITPAISNEARELTMEAVKAAKRNGLIVSCDLNFRKKLWTIEQARSVMSELMAYTDVCMGGREDAVKVLGFTLSERNGDDTPNLPAYEEMFRNMVEKYSFSYVTCSVRRSHTASDNELSGLLYDGHKLYQAKNYRMAPMVDRVGGGDAFAAGMISAILQNKTPQEAVDFATAASVLKHTIPGDVNLVTTEEVEALMNGKKFGRVSR